MRKQTRPPFAGHAVVPEPRNAGSRTVSLRPGAEEDPVDELGREVVFFNRRRLKSFETSSVLVDSF